MRVGDGRMDEVRCKPDINVANLAKRIKEEFKPKLEQWAPADLMLKFRGVALKPHEQIDKIPDEKDDVGEPVPVTVEMPPT